MSTRNDTRGQTSHVPAAAGMVSIIAAMTGLVSLRIIGVIEPGIKWFFALAVMVLAIILSVVVYGLMMRAVRGIWMRLMYWHYTPEGGEQ